MDTTTYIEMLKLKKKKPIHVAMRGAIIYFLHSQKIPVSIIAECMRVTRRNCYYQFYQTRNLLESGDAIMRQAYDEISEHKIKVRPSIIDDNIFLQHSGYNLIIDNKIY